MQRCVCVVCHGNRQAAIQTISYKTLHFVKSDFLLIVVVVFWFNRFCFFPNLKAASTATVTQQADPNDLAVILSAISVPNIFDDDRDTILAKFNKMQAFLGVGQGYFNKSAQPINFIMENPFCRFKV